MLLKLYLISALWTISASTTKARKSVSSNQVYMCTEQETPNSVIYCKGGPGSILDTVSVKLKLYKDPKDFVDSPLKDEPDVVLTAWKDIDQNSKSAVQSFVNKYFDPPKSELDECTPSDWKGDPEFLTKIKDSNYRMWASELNIRWKELCRKMKDVVYKYPNRTSLISVPHPFIVPGGRFREFYYWDTYWIIRGLLVSEMFNTTKNIILNFAEMVDRFGFVPNGGRVYYLRRSQPPLLIPMVNEYIKVTNDVSFLSTPISAGKPTLIEIMKSEFDFWMHNRSVNIIRRAGDSFTAYQYRTRSNTPRPESYPQDLTTASGFPDEKKPEVYRNLASTAESGLDFSSRWFGDGLNLTTIKTTRIVPVELNAYLCQNARILSNLTALADDTGSSDTYLAKYKQLMTMVNGLFWNNDIGTWFSYDLDRRDQNSEFYPTSLVPLYTGCYSSNMTQVPSRVYTWLEKTGALSFINGVPASFIQTGQQWDYPNGWPPLNHIVIQALRTSQNETLQEAAFDLARKWLAVNYKVYKKTTYMFEKYDVEDPSCVAGHGGEYDVQLGFGWTNGVVLDLLKIYGDRLVAPKDDCSSCITIKPYNMLLFLVIVVTVLKAMYA